MITELIKAAQTEVENHSIYVWGGSGQLCCEVSEEWIRRKEAGRRPDDAVKAWEEVESGPYRDAARCFDCSGYVSWCLIQAGVLKHRTDCDGLYARCTEIYTPEDGCLLFRVNPKKPSDETHVGLYIGGQQYHAKGRKYGVVCERYNEREWQRIAWFKALKPDPVPEPPKPEPTGQMVKVVGKSVWVRDADSTKGKKLFVAHRGDTFPLLGVAPSGWYEIDTKKGAGFITNKPRYTEVVK
jgi:cell wall-associated NlpC family hydrolase